MLNGLLQSHARTLLILEHTYVERERSRFFLYLGEYSTCRFHLELVRNRMVALVDRRPRLLQPCLVRHRKQSTVEYLTDEHKKLLFTFPSSPDDTRMSIPYTSPSANVAVSKSFFCPSAGLRMIRFFPSMTFCVCWHDNMPVRTSLAFCAQSTERHGTFDGLAVPCRCHLAHRLRYLPVFVAHAHETHRNLSSGPRGA